MCLFGPSFFPVQLSSSLESQRVFRIPSLVWVRNTFHKIIRAVAHNTMIQTLRHPEEVTTMTDDTELRSTKLTPEGRICFRTRTPIAYANRSASPIDLLHLNAHVIADLEKKR